MKTFSLNLQSNTLQKKLTDVISFTGEDVTGKFGILAHHTNMITCLNYGLAWFKDQNSETTYIALTGGILRFNDNTLTITTRRFILNNNYQEIDLAITKTLQQEEENIKNIQQELNQLEKSMLLYLLKLKRRD